MIRFSSSVLITKRFAALREFYEAVLGQQVQYDFGSCIQYRCALSVWELRPGYPLAKALGGRDPGENGGLELCFETDDFDADAVRVLESGAPLVHGVVEETWGQRTLRCCDPDGNIVELGERMPCFCRRLKRQGMDASAVAQKAGVAQALVRQWLKEG